MKVLLENLLRFEDGRSVTKADLSAIADWIVNKGESDKEIAYRPARVLMQDFTGVPAVVDLAAMRDAMKALGGDPRRSTRSSRSTSSSITRSSSTIFGTRAGLRAERRARIRAEPGALPLPEWGQSAFSNFRVVPPGTGICHQVNLEYLSQTVWTSDVDGVTLAYPDTVVGTDSHTTMVNGLGVLGWGVGGIEAEAAMLGQPISMLIPEVVGFRLTGELQEGVPRPTSCSP